MLLSRQQCAIEGNISNPHVEIGRKDRNQEEHQQTTGYQPAIWVDDTDTAGDFHRPCDIDQKQGKWQKRWNDLDKYLRVSEMRDSNKNKGESKDGADNMVNHKVSKAYRLLIIHYIENCEDEPTRRQQIMGVCVGHADSAAGISSYPHSTMFQPRSWA